MLKWFDAREAQAFGAQAADFLLQRVPAGAPATADRKSLRRFADVLQKVHAQARAFRAAHPLNFYQRARLLNAFQWRLVEGGYDEVLAGELSRDLLRSL